MLESNKLLLITVIIFCVHSISNIHTPHTHSHGQTCLGSTLSGCQSSVWRVHAHSLFHILIHANESESVWKNTHRHAHTHTYIKSLYPSETLTQFTHTRNLYGGWREKHKARHSHRQPEIMGAINVIINVSIKHS